VFCVLFTAYIFITFFAQPVSCWITVSEYTSANRAVLMGIHFVGGTLILLLGPLQLVSKIRAKKIDAHRWIGRIYLVSVVFTCIAGIIYCCTQLTIGGVQMNVTFGLYGILFLGCAVMSYINVKKKKIALHREWALRTFSLGIGSMLYRVYILPLFITSVVPSFNLPDSVDGLLWLDIAAWVFYFPNLLICEIYIRYTRNNNAQGSKHPQDITIKVDEVSPFLAK